MLRRSLRSALLPAAVVLASASATATATAETTAARAVLDEIRAAHLEPDRTVSLRNVELDLGLATLAIRTGHLVPAAPVAGGVREAVFVGQGVFRLTPPDTIEAWQLELFTGERQLETSVNRAVLAFGNLDIVSRLLERPPGEPLEAEGRGKAEDLFASWVRGPERKGFGTDAALWMAAGGDAGSVGYFAALLDSERHGLFYYLLDPSELEQVMLGQFVPLELDDLEAYRAQKEIRRSQRQGRSIQLRLEDIGDWDTWVRSSLRQDDGRTRPGTAGFEPRHYRIEATLDNDELRIAGSSTVELVAVASGRRGITFELFADLMPIAVRDGSGRALDWYRSGSELHVLLAEPAALGDVVSIAIDYGGVLLERYEKGILVNRSTSHWYPRTGTFDRATYDVTLRWPKGLRLLGSGKVVESAVEAGRRVERRQLELPAMGFTFEVGDYDVHTEQVGHVFLTVGFSKTTVGAVPEARGDVLETLRGALVSFERDFGAYPLDYLTVATVPRGFSQGLASFLTLSHHLMAYYSRNRHLLGQSEDEGSAYRRETVAHELAHQWWGNKVGWYNYRDQWLSEALASYSAMTYAARESERPSVRLARNAEAWRRSLYGGTEDGRTVASLGPVVLGERLVSSKSRDGDAYVAVVYDKGSMIFSMLARMLGDEQLTVMLRTLADAVSNRAVDTDVFLRSLERMSGADLSAFARRFVHGTSLPEIHYDYRIEEAEDGGWLVRGTARPVGHSAHRCTLVRTEIETWDVLRERSRSPEDADLGLVVPFQVVLAGTDTEQAKKERTLTGYATGRGFGGELLLGGGPTTFSVPIRERPTTFWLDQRGEVLARFYNETRAPKRVLRFKAMDLEGDEARRLLEQALSAPLVSEEAHREEGWSEKELRQRTDHENARIHLELARMHLDLGAAVAARAALASADKLFEGPGQPSARELWYLRGMLARDPGAAEESTYGLAARRDALACRLAVREGDYKEAFERLARKLYLDIPRGDSIADDLLRQKWQEGYVGNGDEYALLAVAAFENGKETIARLAAIEAEARGADITELRKLLPRDPPASTRK